MRPIQAYVPKERILPSREIVKERQALWGVRVAGCWWLAASGWGAPPPTRHPRIVCVGHEVKYFHCPS